MLTFKQFIEQSEQSEEDKDILNTLSKIPQSHAALVKGYTFKFQGGNTLDGDDDHIGYVQDDPKVIVVAAPWNYGREFTLLHEIGHRVHEKLPKEYHHRWAQIVARTPDKQPQSPEELFCMAYACHYAKNKITIHDHPEWHKFVEELPK